MKNETPKKQGMSWTLKICLIISVIVLLVLMYIGLENVTAKPIMQITQLDGYFIDVNGDGMLDYVVSSEVIINDGGLNLPSAP